ncbi:MAG: hypothetical protein PUF72_00140 [Clostridiales bacterium]|nr:hypothetical protein [Clostridiales bacterium]
MKKRILTLIWICVFCITLLPCNAFAVGLGDADLNVALQKAYQFIKTISIPLGAVGIAFSAFHFFFLSGSQNILARETDEAKRTIMNIVKAIICLSLLPLLISFVIGIFENNGWQAGASNAVIIDPPANMQTTNPVTATPTPGP